MLSRHYLRSKVLQFAYAAQNNGESLVKTIHNFEYHINHLNDLGVLQVATLTQMVEEANKMFEEGKSKYLPTEEDLHPNTKIVDNIFIRRIADNYNFRQALEKAGNCWELHNDAIREAFNTLRKKEIYKKYIENPEHDYESDKLFVVEAFKVVMTHPAIFSVIEERSLLWDDDFYQIAQYNFMMLKTLNEETFDEGMPWPLMNDMRVEKDKEAYDFARLLLEKTLTDKEANEAIIRQFLQGWELERVMQMDVLLVSMAITEFKYCETIPEKVSMDEYIELSKEFSSERSKLFINGILYKINIYMQSQGMIHKTGRGLITMDEYEEK